MKVGWHQHRLYILPVGPGCHIATNPMSYDPVVMSGLAESATLSQEQADIYIHYQS